jgi:glyoxylase-like metal-dependent hydrolase (beta-lactamase superfamily II)
MLQIKKFTVNPFQENTYLLYVNATAVFVDPGYANSTEFKQALDFINENSLSPIAIWLTHAHIDHVMGLAFVEEAFPDIPIYMHPLEDYNLSNAEMVANAYGIPLKPFKTQVDTTKSLENLDSLSIENESFNLIFAPGHSPGHICFQHEGNSILVGGDVLFLQSIGRTDLPGGDFDTLQNSIQQKVYKLPDETIVYSGHGPETNIGFEKKNNAFVRSID